MTIKKRLAISNVLMILVPVLIATFVGACSVQMVVYVVENGTQVGLQNDEEITTGSEVVVELAKHWLKGGTISETQRKAMQGMVDTTCLRVVINNGHEQIYDYGEVRAADAKLMAAGAAMCHSGAIASIGNRNVYCGIEHISGIEYHIYVFGTKMEGFSMGLKTALILTALCILIAIISSIWIMNWILTKYVFKKIEQPLDILTNGVQEIGQGNLKYRIYYDKEDEFKPACEAFNEMALRLQTSVEQTKRNEESRKELLAGISHDIRSPLTSIRAYVEGLLDGIAETPESRQRYLLTIKRKAEDIDRMVNQIFMFSKLDLDEYPMTLRTICIHKELQYFVEECRAEYEQKGIVVFLDETVKFEADIDKEQFERVLRNIIDNSAKYKNKEVGHVHISMRMENDRCQIRMEDDGPGVGKEAVGKLFDAFYRTDPARKNPAGGSGLGLAIAAKTMERMQGEIWAECEDNCGLSVIISLNRKELSSNGENTDY